MVGSETIMGQETDRKGGGAFASICKDVYGARLEASRR